MFKWRIKRVQCHMVGVIPCRMTRVCVSHWGWLIGVDALKPVTAQSNLNPCAVMQLYAYIACCGGYLSAEGPKRSKGDICPLTLGYQQLQRINMVCFHESVLTCVDRSGLERRLLTPSPPWSALPLLHSTPFPSSPQWHSYVLQNMGAKHYVLKEPELLCNVLPPTHLQSHSLLGQLAWRFCSPSC